MKLLWIEDEEELLAEGSRFLQGEGWQVVQAGSAEEAPAVIRDERPDLLLVDWTLSGAQTGLDLCRRNDKEWQLPLLMVTAKGDEFDRVLALELGADDYIQKPFSLRELSARMKAVLRRSGRAAGVTEQEPRQQPQAVVRHGPLAIHPEEFTAFMDGNPLELTRTEFLLLDKLAGKPGRVFTRAHLLEEALGDAYAGYERTIDSHIRNLRRKLGDDPANPLFILTVYGVGYKFNPEVEPQNAYPGEQPGLSANEQLHQNSGSRRSSPGDGQL